MNDSRKVEIIPYSNLNDREKSIYTFVTLVVDQKITVSPLFFEVLKPTEKKFESETVNGHTKTYRFNFALTSNLQTLLKADGLLADNIENGKRCEVIKFC